MITLSTDYIRKNIAPSDLIFHRGLDLYRNGAFACVDSDPGTGRFVYDVDGRYGDYTTRVQLLPDDLTTSCDCPFPGKGCKHTIAALLDVEQKLKGWEQLGRDENRQKRKAPPDDVCLTADEIREQALADRKKRAGSEGFTVVWGDMLKGEHTVETVKGKQYLVTLHDPPAGKGHCTCPDYETNRLGTCKHLLFLQHEVRRDKAAVARIASEQFPFVDIYWDSVRRRPRLFCERPEGEVRDARELWRDFFADDGDYLRERPADLMALLRRLDGNKRVRFQESLLNRIEHDLLDAELAKIPEDISPALGRIRADLYPYQVAGVQFALRKKAALIGDEMGLGKTLQAIAIGVIKKELFGFSRILVVTLSSLKEQWKREIERFVDEKAVIVAGNPMQRRAVYDADDSLFKITNYEAVLRDVDVISRYNPDLMILDEAQRIKNFNTKTADAVKNIRRRHALVLTGTPLENKLEDVYSIVQFLDPYLLSPLWRFAADHFMLSRQKKGQILGYRNLDRLHEKLKTIVIRRRKEEVLSDLPEQIVNNYYVELTDKQAEIHNGYFAALVPLLNKKFLTPMDIRRIQQLLLMMRMTCDATYLVDRQTNISPKLTELEGIIDELVVQNGHKVVIFSEWTTMIFLIGKYLSSAGINFIELTGKVPVNKRQALIDAFTNNPDCKVFLSSDAGGTGLNLQAADCVINFELPWNPARINQRIGRVNRIGQKSRCINVVNLIAKNSIEEKILAGIQLKTALFDGVFEGAADTVEFSQAKRAELLNQLREMMGEEPVAVSGEHTPAEELPEDTPHYLNPRVLDEKVREVAYDAEEVEAGIPEAEPAPAEAAKGVSDRSADGTAAGSPAESSERSPRPVGEAGRREGVHRDASPERMTEVLNTGMQFISGLMEMATGRKMTGTHDDGRMVHIDHTTGEVTLKFKLPGF
ncbi:MULTISPECIES: DEAD/DEAH box helicase [Desulfococcus]|jgi:superfamily II DNA or RNA helicase|uniref:SNF2-related protein n=1 Tax=Desulfococcus multivorans DSM 2059 TaxID=1121405 RepID=S7TVQ5_DESML|nr:DEAD/DEAH box helicase [Desulfococcus multivorans]AOY60352.1 helicase, Snf2 family [Desulfococcus multivorans]AQV02455.1 helicase [Desulfococcus multivorans]EPR41137.1 SNF2-related protein [Desulfococcus multivorans DSM 2059]SJZ59510.1 Superfamily II DNA or RNA helicase, SNF2 family [Desulfococcus multivorans DSM 2059]